jgi:tRNA (cmo5U34)-methyltransferase
MTLDSESFEVVRWHSPEYVESWLNNKTEEAERDPIRKKMVSLLPFNPEDTVKVLDLGAGSGALSQEILANFPKAQIVCQDFSDIMLDVAKQQLAKFSGQTKFVRSDFSAQGWTDSVSGEFDAVVCSFVIHAIPVRAREIYQEVFGLTKPGGCFLIVDSISAPGPVLKKLYSNIRLKNLQRTLKTEKGIEKSLAEIEMDLNEKSRGKNTQTQERVRSPLRSMLTLENHLSWLKQAGFGEADCLWKDLQHGVIIGIKL